MTLPFPPTATSVYYSEAKNACSRGYVRKFWSTADTQSHRACVYKYRSPVAARSAQQHANEVAGRSCAPRSRRLVRIRAPSIALITRSSPARRLFRSLTGFRAARHAAVRFSRGAAVEGDAQVLMGYVHALLEGARYTELDARFVEVYANGV